MPTSADVITRRTLGLAGLVLVCGPVLAASDAGATDTVDAMALYAQGSAVVQDKRTLDLEQGRQTLQWPAPGVVKADTLWLTGSGVSLDGFQVSQSQSNGDGVLASRINKSVTLTPAGDGKSEQGQLVAVNGDVAYVSVDGQIRRVTPSSPTQLSWSGDVDSGDAPSPSALSLEVNAQEPGKQALTATYQMDAPSWQASYTGRFDPDSGQLNLQAKAIIDNANHAALDADKAWLVAGDVSRAGHNGPQPMRMMAQAKSSDSAGKPQASGAVYRYPLEQGLHVPADVTQAISLMQPVQFAAKQHYRFDHYALADDAQSRSHAGVELSFNNSSDAPLPAGAVRIYNASGQAQLMGGDQIDDTPQGAPARLSLGQAFDITGTHQIVDQSSGDDSADSRTIKITLYNASDETHPVTVSERLPNGATLARDAPETSGGSASQPQWQVEVPANGQQSLTYTLQMPARQ